MQNYPQSYAKNPAKQNRSANNPQTTRKLPAKKCKKLRKKRAKPVCPSNPTFTASFPILAPDLPQFFPPYVIHFQMRQPSTERGKVVPSIPKFSDSWMVFHTCRVYTIAGVQCTDRLPATTLELCVCVPDAKVYIYILYMPIIDRGPRLVADPCMLLLPQCCVNVNHSHRPYMRLLRLRTIVFSKCCC